MSSWRPNKRILLHMVRFFRDQICVDWIQERMCEEQICGREFDIVTVQGTYFDYDEVIAVMFRESNRSNYSVRWSNYSKKRQCSFEYVNMTTKTYLFEYASEWYPPFPGKFIPKIPTDYIMHSLRVTIQSCYEWCLILKTGKQREDLCTFCGHDRPLFEMA